MPRKIIPVTVLSGFLGAGKTTVLQHILNNTQGMKVAVIINDMSEVNIDALVVQNQGELVQADAEMVQLQNGCICCTLRQDLLREVARLSRSGLYDYILIESSGISEPLPIAQTFTFESQGESLRKLARLDTLVTLVDASTFWDMFHREEKEDTQGLAMLLACQVEFADVIILNKVDLAAPDDLDALEGLVKRVNPRAKIIRSLYGEIPLKEVLGTHRFNYLEAESSAAWEEELVKDHVPETEEFGISSLAFRVRRPFHPGRLQELLKEGLPGVVRAKGYMWLAGDSNRAWFLTMAGKSLNASPAGFWWAAVPKSSWPRDKAWRKAVEEAHVDPWGDRRQELVCIGRAWDPQSVYARLTACLLTDGEMPRQDQWRGWFESVVKGDALEGRVE